MQFSFCYGILKVQWGGLYMAKEIDLNVAKAFHELDLSQNLEQVCKEVEKVLSQCATEKETRKILERVCATFDDSVNEEEDSQRIEAFLKIKAIIKFLDQLFQNTEKGLSKEAIIDSFTSSFLRELIEQYLLEKEEDNFDITTVGNIHRQIITSYPTLTPKEQQEWLQKITTYHRKEDMEAFALHNWKLILKIANRFHAANLSFDDLVQEGYFGMRKAIEKFDLEKGYQFSTYATWWIKKAIGSVIAQKDRTIAIPIYMARKVRKFQAIRQRLLQETGNNPSLEEIAKKMQISVAQAKELEQIGMGIVSLEVKIGDDTEAELVDFISDDSIHVEDTVLDGMESQQLRRLIDEIITKPREKEILWRRFGLNPQGKRETLTEIGRSMGVTRESIRIQEARALVRLKGNPKFQRAYADVFRDGQFNERTLFSILKRYCDSPDLEPILQKLFKGPVEMDLVKRMIGIDGDPQTVSQIQEVYRDKLSPYEVLHQINAAKVKLLKSADIRSLCKNSDRVKREESEMPPKMVSNKEKASENRTPKTKTYSTQDPYAYLIQKYSREVVETLFANLTEYEARIIHQAIGEDYQNPTWNAAMTKEERDAYFQLVLNEFPNRLLDQDNTKRIFVNPHLPATKKKMVPTSTDLKGNNPPQRNLDGPKMQATTPIKKRQKAVEEEMEQVKKTTKEKIAAEQKTGVRRNDPRQYFIVKGYTEEEYFTATKLLTGRSKETYEMFFREPKLADDKKLTHERQLRFANFYAVMTKDISKVRDLFSKVNELKMNLDTLLQKMNDRSNITVVKVGRSYKDLFDRFAAREERWTRGEVELALFDLTEKQRSQFHEIYDDHGVPIASVNRTNLICYQNVSGTLETRLKNNRRILEALYEVRKSSFAQEDAQRSEKTAKPRVPKTSEKVALLKEAKAEEPVHECSIQKLDFSLRPGLGFELFTTISLQHSNAKVVIPYENLWGLSTEETAKTMILALQEWKEKSQEIIDGQISKLEAEFLGKAKTKRISSKKG